MKQEIVKILRKVTKLPKQQIEDLLEVPPSQELGDFAFPCFTLAKTKKKAPNQIAEDFASTIKLTKGIERIETKGPYLNFFLDNILQAEQTLKKIQEEKDSYGSSKKGKGKTVVVEYSSPNIAKPFGIGHLRSTIIGQSIANIHHFLNYKVKRLSHPGDWGTQFGKLIVGYKKFGDKKKLEKDPIRHLLDIYVKVNQDSSLEDAARQAFKDLEDGDAKARKLWQHFRELSMQEFDRIYQQLGVSFDVIAGESYYEKKMRPVVKELEKKHLLKESERAQIVDLEKYGLGAALIKKSDGATLYLTRDLATAIDRHKTYKFDKMIYEVGAEQQLHFKQLFKVLELSGHTWAKDCVHVSHGLYLDKDGKKFATRKGRTVFMEDIFHETKELAKQEIKKRSQLSEKELNDRAQNIARAAILYGDLKNYRANNIVFDIDRFVSFEGDTGPYLLYTYARATSILNKANKQLSKQPTALNKHEKALITHLATFPDIVKKAHDQLAPNQIANYAFDLAQKFNEFYHHSPVLKSKEEPFRLSLVEATAQTLKNALALLGIETIEEM